MELIASSIIQGANCTKISSAELNIRNGVEGKDLFFSFLSVAGNLRRSTLSMNDRKYCLATTSLQQLAPNVGC